MWPFARLCLQIKIIGSHIDFPGCGRGGIVRDPEARQAALARVSTGLEALGWAVQATADSPVTGGDGNVEYLLWARGPA